MFIVDHQPPTSHLSSLRAKFFHLEGEGLVVFNDESQVQNSTMNIRNAIKY